MSRIAIVTDSTSDLTQEQREAYGVTVVPLNVHFGNEVLRDQIDISTPEFMERLATVSELPKTSQPSPGLFEAAYRELAKDHDAILAIVLSSKLSGTFQSASLAAQAVEDTIPVHVVDSQNASLGLAFQVIRAAELAAAGVSVEEIARRLRGNVAAHHMVFFVDTLEFLQRGGRIGRAASLVGGLLKLKPVLRVDEGAVVPFERTRTRSKAIDALRSFVTDMPSVARLGVLYSTERADAEKLADDLAVRIPRNQIVIVQFSPVIGTHVGPGAMGVCVVENDLA